MDDRWLREEAIRLAVGIERAGTTPGEYATAVRQHVRQIEWPPGVTIADNLGPRLPSPSLADWLVTAQESAGFRAATIHWVKGQEFPGVVVVLPGNQLKDLGGHHALGHRDSGTPSELRRVVYVGGSRAQRLLVLAVHETHLGRVAGLLDRDGVPHDRH